MHICNIRPDRDSNLVPPCRLQAPVDTNEPSGPALNRRTGLKMCGVGTVLIEIPWSKHETCIQSCSNAGPATYTVDQH